MFPFDDVIMPSSVDLYMERSVDLFPVLKFPVGTRRKNNVIMSRRRFDVIMTLSLRRVPVGLPRDPVY